MASTIEIIRRDDIALNLSFKDNDGNALDITGSTVFFTVKNSIKDTDDEAIIAVNVTSHTNPAAGQTTIEIDHTDTDIEEGVYIYDMQLKNASGKISSTRQGPFQVFNDVTIRTT